MTKNISLLFVSYGINSYPEISIHNKDTTIDLIILDLRVQVTRGAASRIPNKFTKSCAQNKAIMISQNTGTKTKL
jgi:hypothetical protein